MTRLLVKPLRRPRTGDITQTDKLYTGQQIENGDSALGLYNYKARFYSTTLGRFVSADGLSRAEDRYGYAGGNPLNRTDPTGYCFTFMGQKLECKWSGDESDAVRILECALTCGDNWIGQIMRWGIQRMEFWEKIRVHAQGDSQINIDLLTTFAGAVQADETRWNIMPWVGFFYFGVQMGTTARYFEATLYALTTGRLDKYGALDDHDFVGELPARKWWESTWHLGMDMSTSGQILYSRLYDRWKDPDSLNRAFESRVIDVARHLGENHIWSYDAASILRDRGYHPPYHTVAPWDLDLTADTAGCILSGGRECLGITTY